MLVAQILKDKGSTVFTLSPDDTLSQACAELDLTVTAWFDSPIEGGDGNREFFICARKAG